MANFGLQGLNALGAEINSASAHLGDLSSHLKNIAAEALRSQVAMSPLVQRLKDVTQANQDLFKAMQGSGPWKAQYEAAKSAAKAYYDAAKELKAFENQMKVINFSLKSSAEKFEEVSQAVSNTGSQLKQFQQSVLGAGSKLLGVGIGLSSLTKTLVDYNRVQMNSGVIAGQFGQSVGDLTPALDRLRQSATTLSKVGFAELNTSFKTMYNGIPPTSEAVLEFAASLQGRLGYAQTEIIEKNKVLLSVQSRIPDLYDKIKSAQSAYARSSTEGAAATQELMMTMKALGATRAEVELAMQAAMPPSSAVREWGNIEKVQARMKQRQEDAVLKLATAMTPVINKLAEAITWVAEKFASIPPWILLAGGGLAIMAGTLGTIASSLIGIVNSYKQIKLLTEAIQLLRGGNIPGIPPVIQGPVGEAVGGAVRAAGAASVRYLGAGTTMARSLASTAVRFLPQVGASAIGGINALGTAAAGGSVAAIAGVAAAVLATAAVGAATGYLIGKIPIPKSWGGNIHGGLANLMIGKSEATQRKEAEREQEEATKRRQEYFAKKGRPVPAIPLRSSSGEAQPAAANLTDVGVSKEHRDILTQDNLLLANMIGSYGMAAQAQAVQSQYAGSEVAKRVNLVKIIKDCKDEETKFKMVADATASGALTMNDLAQSGVKFEESKVKAIRSTNDAQRVQLETTMNIVYGLQQQRDILENYIKLAQQGAAGITVSMREQIQKGISGYSTGQINSANTAATKALSGVVANTQRQRLLSSAEADITLGTAPDFIKNISAKQKAEMAARSDKKIELETAQTRTSNAALAARSKAALPGASKKDKEDVALAEKQAEDAARDLDLFSKESTSIVEQYNTQILNFAKAQPPESNDAIIKKMQTLEEVAEKSRVEVEALNAAIATAPPEKKKALETERDKSQTTLTGATRAASELGVSQGNVLTSISKMAEQAAQTMMDPYEKQMVFLHRSTEYAEKLMNLSEKNNLGLAKSYQYTKQTVELVQKQIVAGKEVSSNLADQMGKLSGGHLTQQDINSQLEDQEGFEKKVAGLTGVDEQKRAQILEMSRRRVEVENKNLDLQSKQADLTKQMREGYLDFMAEKISGGGDFTGLIPTMKNAVTAFMGAKVGVEGTMRTGAIGANQKGGGITRMTEQGLSGGGFEGNPLAKIVNEGDRRSGRGWRDEQTGMWHEGKPGQVGTGALYNQPGSAPTTDMMAEKLNDDALATKNNTFATLQLNNTLLYKTQDLARFHQRGKPASAGPNPNIKVGDEVANQFTQGWTSYAPDGSTQPNPSMQYPIMPGALSTPSPASAPQKVTIELSKEAADVFKVNFGIQPYADNATP